ncbi:MAG: hypothetical protein GC191_12065 [Azospirillum sp.]|nr:hypothetical protein [Azospirillum sp.]
MNQRIAALLVVAMIGVPMVVAGPLAAQPVAPAATVTAPSQAAPSQAAPSQAAPSQSSEDPPLSIVVTRYPKRGCEMVLEELWQQLAPVRGGYPGHLSSDFIRPAGRAGGGYHMIYRFDHASHYQAWLDSAERAAWLARLDRVTEGKPEYQHVTGLEAWVTPSGRSDGRLPERYKTTAVTWLAIFPLVLGVGAAVNPLTVGFSTFARTALVTGIVVPAMGYLVMPAMTWVFQDWLYPPAPQCAG